MKRRLLLGAALSAFALTFTLPMTAPLKAQEQPILVFAAASLKNALDEITAEWMKTNKVEVKISYAVGDVRMPLWLALAGVALLGGILGWFVGRRRLKRSSGD